MDFKDLGFIDVEFERFGWENVTFRDFTWEGIAVEEGTFRKCSIESWNCSFLRGSISLEGVTINKWVWVEEGTDDLDDIRRVKEPFRVSADDVDVGEVDLERVEVRLSGSVRIRKGVVNGGTVILDPGAGQRMDLGLIKFKGSRLTCNGMQRPAGLDLARTSMELCELHNVPFEYNAFSRMRATRRLQSCKGVALVYGVPGADKSFVEKRDEKGSSISSRNWFVMDGELLMVDFGMLRQRAESPAELDRMLVRLSSESRAILREVLPADAAN